MEKRGHHRRRIRIGAATALAFAEGGYDILVNYSRNRDGADEIVAQCRALDANAMAIQGDIAKDSDCPGGLQPFWPDRCVTRQARAADLEASNAADFEAIFSVNVTGTDQMIRAVVPYLERAELGSIVNVSSDSAFSDSGSSLAYAASKGAVNTMTRGLAHTLAPSIGVNAVCPSFVDTTWALAWHSEESYAAFRAGL